MQEESTGLCLEREVHDGRSHGVLLAPCVRPEGASVLELQTWHLANRDPSAAVHAFRAWSGLRSSGRPLLQRPDELELPAVFEQQRG